MTPPDAPTNEAEAVRRRGGRPTAGQAGEVDRRILDAATDLFLRFGFDATTCEKVAAAAGAGKASLYARHANKEALFAAVVRDLVDRMAMPLADLPWHLPVADRLRAAGHMLLAHGLAAEVTELTRAVITAAPRMPDLAKLADRIGREGGLRLVGAALAGKGAPAAAIEQAMPIADRFIDLTFIPHQMQALLGGGDGVMEPSASRRIDDAIVLLTAAGYLST